MLSATSAFFFVDACVVVDLDFDGGEASHLNLCLPLRYNTKNQNQKTAGRNSIMAICALDRKQTPLAG
jgi:hypothetical protein